MDIRTPTAPTAAQADTATIFVAIELSRASWLVALRTPLADKVSQHKLKPGDADGLLSLIADRRAAASRRLGRPVAVRSCYEAGYDGFWLHRVLVAGGIDNQVIDPASVLVNRRARRAKTDRLDVRGLLRTLMAYSRGEHDVCSMVRVPSPEEEDAKRLHRSRQRLVCERTGHTNRIKGLLATQGIYGFQPRRADHRAGLAERVTGDGRALPAGLRREIEDELARLALVEQQIGALEAERDAVVRAAQPAVAGGSDRQRKIQQLTRLRSIGPEFATVLVGEVFYRRFDNRRQLGGYAGLGPSPFNSGAVARDQGIAKSGNPRLRTAMVELAWMWLRHQPDSVLSRWFQDRVNGARGRLKRIMIVALARKLLVALWRYLECGLVPDGARLKT